MHVSGVTGPMVMDFKGDRVMDYRVWYLASDNNKFDGYMKIPLTKAGRNTTACVEWLVKQHVFSMHACDLLGFLSVNHRFISRKRPIAKI